MTTEARTTIQLSDFQAVEFECLECRSRIVRPIDAWQSPLHSCPFCGATWVHYRGTMDFLMKMASQIAKMAEIDRQSDAPFAVRFEIAQSPRKETL